MPENLPSGAAAPVPDVSAADLALVRSRPDFAGAAEAQKAFGDGLDALNRRTLRDAFGAVRDARDALSVHLGFSWVQREKAAATAQDYGEENGFFSAHDHDHGGDSVSVPIGPTYEVDASGAEWVGKLRVTPQSALQTLRDMGYSGPFARQQVDLLQAIHGKVPTGGAVVPEFLGSKYASSSEGDKIGMARVMSDYMGKVGYDHALGGRGEVSSADMWAAYARGGQAGVCRHIHSETAKFLRAAGMEAGVVTTDTRNGGHEITWGKKADGTYFIVDYGDLYESRDPRELKAKYLASLHGISLQEYVGDADGKTIGTIRSDAEEWLAQKVSSSDARDRRDAASDAARAGLKVDRGWSLAGSAASDGVGDARVGYGNGAFQAGVSAGTSGMDGVLLRTASADIAAGASFGPADLRVGVKATGVSARWGDGVYRTFSAVSADVGAAVTAYDDDATRVGLAASVAGSAMTSGAFERSSADGFVDGAASADVAHRFRSGLDMGASVSAGADGVPVTHRYDAGIRPAGKYAADLRAGWSQDGWSAGAHAGASSDVNSTKASAGASAGAGPVSATVEYARDVKMETPFLLPEVSRKIGLAYAVDEALSVAVGYGDRSNGESVTRTGSVSAEARF